jgi:hypothetical protein
MTTDADTDALLATLHALDAYLDLEIRRAEAKASGWGGAKAPDRSSRIPDADAILAEALEVTGHDEAFADDTLDPLGYLDILGAVREIGEAWLRGEAARAIGEPLEKAVGSARGAAIPAAVGKFFGKARRYLRELLTAGVLALNGSEGLSDEDAREIDAVHGKQVAFLDKFRRQIAGGERPLDGTFPARAGLYGADVWGRAQEVVRRGAIRSRAYTHARRIHAGIDKACEVCESEQDKGWQPIRDVLPIGKSPCKCRCHCFITYGSEADVREGKSLGPGWATKRHVPCRDERGRFASCGGAAPGTRVQGGKPHGGGGGAKPRKPGGKPKPPEKPGAGPKKPKPKPKKPAAKPPRDKPRPTGGPEKPGPAAAPATFLDESADHARSLGIKVEPKGHARFVEKYGDRAEAIPASFNLRTGTIYLNEKHDYWEDPATYTARMGKTGLWSTTNRNHAIDHEIAHAIHYREVGPARFDAVLARKFDENQRALISWEVSRYGATEPAEFVAEAYAGIRNGKSYGPEVMDLYQEFGGPKVEPRARKAETP